MVDTIRGPVTSIVDGDTFDMRVDFVGKNNTDAYDHRERIRLAGVNAPEMGTQSGTRAKLMLAARLGGREVMCHVHARDVYGRVVAQVQVL